MNQLEKIFQYGNQEVRTVTKNGEPWFVAKDVASVLYFTDAEAMTRHLDDDEKQNLQLVGFKRGAIVINESGLYSVIIKSRKEEAKQFKRWITHEVIPTIRKHGAYMTPEKLEEVLLSPDTLIRLAHDLKDEREKRLAAEKQIETNKPKVIFADAVSTSKTTILIGELAKLLKQNGVETGQKRLFEWLRDNGFLIKRKGTDYNMPTQRAMELGLFEVKETAVTHSDGHVTISKTTKVTGKGQQYFIEKFLSNQQEVREFQR